MRRFLRHLIRWIDRPFARLDIYDLVAHPLKRLSRRFLYAGMGLSILIHFLLIGGILFYRMYGFGNEKTVTLRIVSYPKHLIDAIDPSKLITSEMGGGGGGGQKAGGEPPPDPGDDILSKGVPVPVEIGIPEPVPDTEVEDVHVTLATQEEMERDIALADEETQAPSEEAGLGGTGGGGTGSGGIGGGYGSGGGGGGDGPPGTWRYDTPPNPRRLITMIQSKSLPKKLRNVDGMVKFRLLIDEFGEVMDASIVQSSGYRELDDLALSAIYKSTFNPATFRGRSVKAWINFGYGFRTRKR